MMVDAQQLDSCTWSAIRPKTWDKMELQTSSILSQGEDRSSSYYANLSLDVALIASSSRESRNKVFIILVYYW